jgi:hypothetical protein
MDLREIGSEDGRWMKLIQIMTKYKVLVSPNLKLWVLVLQIYSAADCDALRTWEHTHQNLT